MTSQEQVELMRSLNAFDDRIHAIEQTLELFTDELVENVAKVNALTSILIQSGVITEDEVESLIEEQKAILLAEILEA